MTNSLQVSNPSNKIKKKSTVIKLLNQFACCHRISNYQTLLSVQIQILFVKCQATDFVRQYAWRSFCIGSLEGMTPSNLYLSCHSNENVTLALTAEMPEICMLEELVTGPEDGQCIWEDFHCCTACCRQHSNEVINNPKQLLRKRDSSVEKMQ